MTNTDMSGGEALQPVNDARYQDAVAAVLFALSYRYTEKACTTEGNIERAVKYREFTASSMGNARSYFDMSNSGVDAEALAQRIDRVISEYQQEQDQ
tara:strand:+ start:67563 stop:67853 length:291 start_codon:yes stop_codon:yes gene_type:complete